MRPLVSALLCCAFVIVNSPVSSRADGTADGSIAAASASVVTPDPFSIAPPRPAGQFVYGTHLAAVDHAALAHQDGFRLMWGYIPWQQVEPTRGNFLFRSQDRWGKPTRML